MRLIFYIIVAFIVYRLAKRFLVGSGGSVRRGGGVHGGGANADVGAGEPVAEETVLDTVCGSYLAKSLAIKVDVGGKTHFFCGEECRDKFNSEKGA